MEVKMLSTTFRNWASKNDRKMFFVHINDKRHVEVAYNDRYMEALVFENGKHIDGKAFGAGNKTTYMENVAATFAYLNKLGANALELANAYRKILASKKTL